MLDKYKLQVQLYKQLRIVVVYNIILQQYHELSVNYPFDKIHVILFIYDIKLTVNCLLQSNSVSWTFTSQGFCEDLCWTILLPSKHGKWTTKCCVCQAQQQASEDNVRYELDEYYFMPAPSQLVFTHFPDDPDWQLLERKIDLDEFESLVPLKPTFFKLGLHLLSHTNAVITCPAGHDVSIRIECPQKKVDTVTT